MKISSVLLLITIIMTLSASPCMAALELSPAKPASMSITCPGGEVTLPNGTTVSVQACELSFDKPEIVANQTKKGKASRNYASWFKPYEPWPGSGKAINLAPKSDEQGVRNLSGLYGSIMADTIVVKSADGSKTFVPGKDYIVLEDWGQVANLNGGLGEEGKAEVVVSFSYALQRIDLVQVCPDGAVKVKKGKSAMVCPMIPTADDGCAAVAGIYIKAWRVKGDWVIDAKDIYPVNPAEPVAPINPSAISRTMAKLRAGKPVNIGIMGDSVTLGAESGPWWNEFSSKDRSYRALMFKELKQRFPKSAISPIKGYEGGKTTKYGVEVLKSKILPGKPDLVTIAFGLNDATCGIGGKPRVSGEQFREYITNIVRACKEAGAEVILITPMQPSPFQKNRIAKNILAHVRVLREIGEAENVAVADVYAEWMNLASHGIPPFSQLHNWINHPGPYGHKLYADTILRLFED